MRAVKALGVALVGLALLAVAATGSAAPRTAKAPAFRTYVGCRIVPPGASPQRKRKLVARSPSHSCAKTSKQGAIFVSRRADVNYKVCVLFPVPPIQCSNPDLAPKGEGRYNSITSSIPGIRKVTWYANGKLVGHFVFNVRP